MYAPSPQFERRVLRALAEGMSMEEAQERFIPKLPVESFRALVEESLKEPQAYKFFHDIVVSHRLKTLGLIK